MAPSVALVSAASEPDTDQGAGGENSSPPMSQTGAPRRRRASPVRGSTLAFVAAVAVTAGGAGFLATRQGVPVLVANRDLPAFQQVSQADVRETLVPRSSLPSDYKVDADAVVGTYTLDSLKQGETIAAGSLGPRVAVDVGHLATAALDATPAQALDGRLRPGDRIRLVPKGQAKATETQPLANVLVLRISRQDSRYVVTFGLTPKQLTQYESADFADWRLIRDAPYEAP